MVDYALVFSVPDAAINPKPTITERQRTLILCALSFLEDRQVWEHDGADLIDIEWDAIEALLGDLTNELG